MGLGKNPLNGQHSHLSVATCPVKGKEICLNWYELSHILGACLRSSGVSGAVVDFQSQILSRRA